MAQRSLLTLSLALIAAGLVAASLLLAIDFELSGRDAHLQQLERRLAKAPLDVVLMGDSVISAQARCDRHRAGIDHLLADRLQPFSVHAIHSGGLSLYIYRDYVRALRHTAQRPKLLVIEINPAALDLGAGMHPAARFHTRRLHNQWRETQDPALLAQYWRYRFGGEFNREVAAWRQIELNIPDRGMVRLADFEQLLKQPPNPGCAEERHAGADMQLAQSTPLSFRLTAESRIWGMISEVNAIARDLKMRPVFYLTPVNVAAVESYAPKLDAVLDANRAMLRQRIEAEEAILLDFSTLVAGEHFIDLLCACGHMDATGREQLSEALAQAVRPLLAR